MYFDVWTSIHSQSIPSYTAAVDLKKINLSRSLKWGSAVVRLDVPAVRENPREGCPARALAWRLVPTGAVTSELAPPIERKSGAPELKREQTQLTLNVSITESQRFQNARNNQLFARIASL
jgi:hypothetical protein